MKISPKSIKKEVEEKQLAEKEVERKIRFKETLQKSRFNGLMSRCLEAAVAGDKEVDLGYEFYDLKDIEEQILDKWIDIKYLSKDDYLIKKIFDKLKSFKSDHIKAIYDLNGRKLEGIISGLNDLRPYANSYENVYLDHCYEQALLALQKSDKSLAKSIFCILQAKDAFGSLLFDFDSCPSQDLKEELKLTKEEIKLALQQLSSPYEGLLPVQEGFLKKPHAICLKWDKKMDASAEKNSTDDELDAYSLTYLASSEGQSFIDRLKNLVEQEMAIDNNRLFITLSKIGNRYSIKLSDSEEIKTVYNEISLERLLIRIGYRLEKQLSGEDESNYLLIWKN